MYDGRLGLYHGCAVEEAVCQTSSSLSVRNCTEQAKGLQKEEMVSWRGSCMLLQGLNYISASAFNLCDTQQVT